MVRWKIFFENSAHLLLSEKGFKISANPFIFFLFSHLTNEEARLKMFLSLFAEIKKRQMGRNFIEESFLLHHCIALYGCLPLEIQTT